MTALDGARIDQVIITLPTCSGPVASPAGCMMRAIFRSPAIFT
jgi:hypothetical protein